MRDSSPELPSRHNSRVPRDLEIICLKCLEKEPNRRYPSALALAEDLDRWLGGNADRGAAGRLADPRRHVVPAQQGAGLAGSALDAGTGGGLAGVTWKWREADHERAKAEAVNDLLNRRLLAQASLEFDPLAKNLTVRELLDRAAGAARRLARWSARSRGQDPRNNRRCLSLARRIRASRETAPRRDAARQQPLRPEA